VVDERITKKKITRGRTDRNKITGRRLALLSLVRIEKQGAYANRILNALFTEYNPEDREKGLATDIVYGTLRNLTFLDYVLGYLLSKPLSVLPPVVRCTLRFSLYQIVSGPETAYAVVDQAVKLVKTEGYGRLSGLVNAILRRYLREGKKIPLPDFKTEPLAHLTVVHSHPEWLIKRWAKQWSYEELHELVRNNNRPAPFSVRTNTLKISRDIFLAKLTAAGIEAVPSTLVPEGLRILNPRKLATTPFFKAGYYYIQDEASMLVSHFVSPVRGETLVDLCAAPGSKTTHLAQLMKDKGLIYALDDHEHKVELIAANAGRLGITSIKTIVTDAGKWTMPEKGLADRVLLDAPCTGTGVLRRRPDIRWQRTPRDLKNLVVLQGQLLQKAATLVRPGGILVYSTCSLESEENEEQIRKFLVQHPEFTVDITYLPSGLKKKRFSEGILILPLENGPDGFFLTRLLKSENCS